MRSKNPYSQEEKLFSVCTPIYDVTYKHLPTLAKHLSQQDYKNFEWVVIFDGPHSRGVKTMQKLRKEYPEMNINWYVKEHEGACAARNYGATKLKGEYWAFINGDCYPYPETLRVWANAFDEDPEIYRVWGLYDIIKEDGKTSSIGLGVPIDAKGNVWYKGFKYSNYTDSCFPVRRDHFVEWDNNCKSLQDWEWALSMLEKDNYTGKGWKFINESFFAAELPKKGGLSDDSHSNWIERTDYVRNKHNVPKSDICVTSLGAPAHGFRVADMLGADYLPMPSYKPHRYKVIYLLGFYTKENPEMQKAGIFVTQSHMEVFKNFDGKKIIHWIGTDILQLYKNASFEKLEVLKKWFKDEKIIHLAEAEFTKKELKKFGINAKVVPIPPVEQYEVTPLPEQFSVGIYMPFDTGINGEKRPNELYLPDLTDSILRAMPDVKFYFFGDDFPAGWKKDNWEYIGYIDYKEWMPKFSCNLRLTYHDGLPITCLQFMSAGRQVVTNVPVKGAIQVNLERKSIVEGIRKAQESGKNIEGIKYVRKLTPEKYKKTIWRYV